MVKAGDTLYSISFSTGQDWRELAALNGIGPPYTIYPGQRLRLGKGAVETGPDPDLQQEPPPIAAYTQPAPATT